MEQACQIIIKDIINGKIKTRRDLEVEKRQLCRDLKLNKFMSNADILENATVEEKKIVSDILKKKPSRTLSGVAVVAVMCHPHECPHGRCFYCPKSAIAPPSYTGEEPAALRGRMFEYHPYIQTFNRIKQLYSIGHPVDKIELIIMGGTFPSTDLSYQEWFVSQCLKAMVDFGIVLENIDKGMKLNDITQDIINKNSIYTEGKLKTYKPNDYVLIENVQKVNENSKVRCVGMTFETRPDWCKEEHVDRMLNMGATRVEIGVQTIHEDIYKKIKRGHTVKDSVEANRILRDSGLKVAMHFMPGLFQKQKEDIEMFKTIFSDESYKPDMLKIYPVLVTKGSELYDLWKDGGYEPYNDEEAVELIVQIKKILPKWVRTMRIQRDIPSTLIEAGVKKSNLGELVYQRLKEENISCKCIRCRELGRVDKKFDLEDYYIFEESYNAVGGKETFLSFEDENEESLAGFLRLRMPSNEAHRDEINEDTALLRELHVYGNMLKIGEKATKIGQHNGFGERLIKRAEEISIESGKSEILVTSGIGARKYYRKFGYELKGPYMAKKLI